MLLAGSEYRAGSSARPFPGRTSSSDSQELDIPTLRLIHIDGEMPDLRALRLQAGLTVPRLAAAVNVAVPTYYAWEQGRWARLPASKQLDKLALALEQPLDVVDAAFYEAQRQRARGTEK